jgi:SAM-dependent methyltransferase
MSRLREFVQTTLPRDFVVMLARAGGIPEAEMNRSLDFAVEEAELSLDLLAGVDLRGHRILEVGSGMGVLSAYLASEGFSVVSLEPGSLSFVPYRRIAAALHEKVGRSQEHLDIPIEGLSPDLHGTFDLIFSNNVLEHVEDPRHCLCVLDSVLGDGAVMLHNCPNYRVPYEPHFGIPLVPFTPALTRHLLPRRIGDSDLWATLNFITVGDVHASARDRGAQVRFTPAVLAKSFARLDQDDGFGGRHPVLKAAMPLIRASGALRILAAIPAQLATPMVFEWRRTGEPRPGQK